MSIKQIVIALALTSLVFQIGQVTAQSSPETLPELGDVATTYLDSREEERIGRQFFRRLIGSPDFIDDPELIDYLNRLGAKVAQSSSRPDYLLRFSLLQKNDLNAFAVPGGYITFHSGLILTTESESELASVVGHEIAHLTQRHLPRLIAKAEASKLPTTAAIIASILIGGQAGVAGVTLANANLLSNRLAYSREFEKEADAIGLNMMSGQGFDPEATSSFFSKLQRFTLITSKDLPEFLRSHPLSYTRVAEAEARIASLPAQQHESSFSYFLAREKIRALYGERSDRAIRILRERLTETKGIEKDATEYGLALALASTGKTSEALDSLIRLETSHPENTNIQIALATIEGDTGNNDDAIKRLEKLWEMQPEFTYVAHYYIEELLAADRHEEAKKVARYQLRRYPSDFFLYQKLSRANVALENLAEAHQADAEYLAALGRYRGAIAALKLALRDSLESNQYLRQSVKARLAQLEEIAAREKKINGAG